jgi:hypothetical protein
MDGENLEFDAGSFDAILCGFGLTKLTSPSFRREIAILHVRVAPENHLEQNGLEPGPMHRLHLVR